MQSAKNIQGNLEKEVNSWRAWTTAYPDLELQKFSQCTIARKEKGASWGPEKVLQVNGNLMYD